MGNKIIIDEEVLFGLEPEGLNQIEGFLKLKKLILENSTTISIDESIEDKTDVFLLDFIDWFGSWQNNKNLPDYGINDILKEYKKTDSYKQGATEQSIISEINTKELITWIYFHFTYSYKEKGWYHNEYDKVDSVHYNKHYTIPKLIEMFKEVNHEDNSATSCS